MVQMTTNLRKKYRFPGNQIMDLVNGLTRCKRCEGVSLVGRSAFWDPKTITESTAGNLRCRLPCAVRHVSSQLNRLAYRNPCPLKFDLVFCFYLHTMRLYCKEDGQQYVRQNIGSFRRNVPFLCIGVGYMDAALSGLHSLMPGRRLHSTIEQDLEL